MSGETTNYLGIICVVAGLFFVVVFASICMSCVKCCKKQIAKKRASAPPQGIQMGSRVASVRDQDHSLVNGRAGGRGSIVSHTTRAPTGGGVTRPATGRAGLSRASSGGSMSRVGSNRNRVLVRMHQGSKSMEVGSPRHSYYNLDSGSVPDLAREQPPPPESILKRTSQFCSFESFKSVSSAGGWVTPDQDR